MRDPADAKRSPIDPSDVRPTDGSTEARWSRAELGREEAAPSRSEHSSGVHGARDAHDEAHEEAHDEAHDEVARQATGDGGDPTRGADGEEGESDVLSALDEAVGGADDGDDGGAKAPASRRRDSLLEVAVVVLIALFLALLLKMYVAEAYMIRGQSMKPTFDDGERVIVQKVWYGIERGDIVIFGAKDEPGKDLIKRVIGLPGDQVFVKSNGAVVVNGDILDETYINHHELPRPEYGPVIVPSGAFFVLGDNRPQSQDSRVFASIASDTVKGKVILRWWPIGDLRAF